MNDTTAQHSVTNIAPAFPRKLIVWTATLDGMFAPAINTTTCYVLLRIHGVTIIYSAMPDKYAGPPYSRAKIDAVRVSFANLPTTRTARRCTALLLPCALPLGQTDGHGTVLIRLLHTRYNGSPGR